MGIQFKTPWIILGFIGLVAIIIGAVIGGYHYGKGSNNESINDESISLSLGKLPNDDGNTLSGDNGSLGGGTTSNTNSESCEGEVWKCNIRLDSKVLPIHYELYLHPDIEGGTFTGNVSILLNVTKNVDHFRLHTHELNITNTTVHQGGLAVTLKESFPWTTNDFWIIIPMETIRPEVYTLTISFTGSLTKGIVGFYRSKYYDPVQKTQKFVVSSKFQPTHARRAFPCFDEPSFKSTFTVTMVKPSNLWAVSNMPLDVEYYNHPSVGFATLRYQKSVPMVTYLLAFAIGDFKRREEMSKSGIPISVYSTSFQVNKTGYAASITPKILDFYEDYFGIRYPLPKLDIIGIPDFVSGAMEHWGLISFRETNLFYQEGISSAGNKQRVASVIAHEVAHMWFGNLVTLKWWDSLWLNEGFASYMEYKGVDYVHPDWDMESQFVSSDLTPVLVLDGQRNSHPIVQPVSNPDQITEIFDKISYNKGSSVIRMLENFMGHAKFRSGITKFLQKYSFENAETSDLWNELELESEANMNITLIMDTWTRQMGYPVISTNISEGKLIVEQNRFLESKSANSGSGHSIFNYSWEIPLQIVTSDNLSHVTPFWLKQSDKSATIEISKNTKWVKLNAGQFGYFRVQYSDDSWKEIQKSFLSAFSPQERCGLLDDVFALAYGNYVNYSTALEFGNSITNDSHFVPWDCIIPHLRKICRLLRNSAPESYALSQKYVVDLTTTLYTQQKWKDDDKDPHLNRLLKFDIIALSCENGLKICLDTANTLFKNWINAGQAITPGLRGIVYKYGMLQSNETVWNQVFNRFIKETDPQEKIRLMNCLASSKDSFILQRFLHLAKNESIIRRQDFFTAIKFVASNPVGNLIAWNFYRNEYLYLLKRFTINDRYFGRVIIDITSDFSTPAQYEEMEHFLSHYPKAGAGRRARVTAMENVRNNIEWAKINVPGIEIWLKSQNYL